MGWFYLFEGLGKNSRKGSVDVPAQVAAVGVWRTRRRLVEDSPAGLHTLVGRPRRHGEEPWQYRPNPVFHASPDSGPSSAAGTGSV